MERIDRYFDGVAWKYLSAVDADSSKSNQHEIGGLVKAGFKQYLGDPGHNTIRFPARFVFLAEDDDQSIAADSFVSWYDSRRGDPERSAELRLYYETNRVTEALAAGMLFVIAKSRDNGLFLIFANAETTAEQQLRWLFGLDDILDRFEAKPVSTSHERATWSSLWILEQLGIEIEIPDEGRLDKILDKFGSRFPPTKQFSEFARQWVTDIDLVKRPDDALIAFMSTEEGLFRLLERYIVEQRLKEGFDDVDIFIAYSLSVQNRRKSRAGHALENHLAHIFAWNGIQYERGVHTENRTKPDFLFPGGEAYRDPTFPVTNLSVLGVKSSCKDRWRQVLAEANRIPHKHLATLEPGISRFQTDEMKAHKLQLVVPAPVHETYVGDQRNWLMNLQEFVGLVRHQQAGS